MKNATNYIKPMMAFLKQLRKKEEEAWPELDAVTQLVMGFLQWNAGYKAAASGYERLMGSLVDNNDLRVSHPAEVAGLLGERYPQGYERALRLHDALQTIFEREHCVGLASLEGKGKKDIKAYLEGLPGMVGYVADQVFLLNFGGHAVPVDDVMLELLKEEELVDPEADTAAVAGFLERHVKAEDAVEVHYAMRMWADAKMGKGKGESGGGKGKKTKKK